MQMQAPITEMAKEEKLPEDTVKKFKTNYGLQ